MEEKLKTILEAQVKRGCDAFVFLLGQVPSELRCEALAFVMHSLNLGIGLTENGEMQLTEITAKDLDPAQKEHLN